MRVEHSELNNLFLALGSNLGNRFDNLQKAVDLLFEEIGAIKAISPIYETPALGFDGANFLNCVIWLRTSLSHSQVLSTIMGLENRLGRIRKNSNGYTSRVIDIDMLSYNDFVVEDEDLSLPHRRMHLRKFVLQPLLDIHPYWKHPQLKKNPAQLLEDTTDKSEIHRLEKELVNPTEQFNLLRFNYIAIEGNIGAGKTSLASMMASDFNAKLILERFKDNPFLPKFYEDTARYAFPLEMSFLADRYQQLMDDIAQYDLFTDRVVADYDVNKSLIFAGITLSEEEYELYRKMFQIVHRSLPQPDLYVYLYQNTERLLQNIHKRGREYERSIKPEYLQNLNRGYLDFIKNRPKGKSKIIDISEMDFVSSRKDYLQVLGQISS